MAERTQAAEPLTVEAMAEHLAGGCKPPSEHRIGSEHEKFVFRASDHAPVPYQTDEQGRGGIQALLTAHERYGWTPVTEEADHGQTLIGMERDGANISLEPGGQFELSGAPLEDVHEVCAETNKHLGEAKAVGGELGLGLFGPRPCADLAARGEIPVMPKGRYDIMRVLHAQGRRPGAGHDAAHLAPCRPIWTSRPRPTWWPSSASAWRCSRSSRRCSPIRRSSTASAERPICPAARIFGPTPIRRAPACWASCSTRGFASRPMPATALDVPMYFVKRDGFYIDASGQSFRDFIDGRTAGACRARSRDAEGLGRSTCRRYFPRCA